jgi:sugar (pentulose or hexulose) kinase
MDREPALWLGIDVGTTGCRVVAVDAAGRLQSAATAPLRSDEPRPGWHEQDPLAWVDALRTACRAVVGDLAARGIGTEALGGLAICATSGTLLLVTADGTPAGPAVMYDDQRAVGLARTCAVLETWADCSSRNGYQPQETWALPKLAWLVDHAGAADLLACCCADFLGWWLTGTRVSADSSHVLKAGYDLVGERWPTEELAAVGIPVEILPEVSRPGSVVGVVGGEASVATGLPEGLPVVAGMTDGCASQIAAGAVRPGQWNLALGTTLVLKGVSERLLLGDALYSHRHPDGSWLPGGASSSGAGVLAKSFPAADLAAMDAAAASYAGTPVVSYPLAREGERFPFVRADAEPFQLGEPADDAERFASLLQGVAYVERLGLAYVDSLGGRTDGQVTLTGGATVSAHWNQVQADVLGRPLAIPLQPDAAFGAAVLAAGSRSSLALAAERMVVVREVIEPRPAMTERYLQGYDAMVAELERRGYIDAQLATEARAA